MHIRFVYMTFASAEEARRVGRQLVGERLAACVNVFPQMTSIYSWEGKMEESAEAVAIAKTTKARVSALIARVKSLHAYSCPCIVSLPVTRGYRPFLEWIAASVADA
jgi:periplasmic divalent cation tolerance protein